jgi:short subunit dehydrogenase-like uncharacterized protein
MRASPSSTRGARRFDVVLWGATGFTGALVAEYIAKHYGGGKLKWAIAGRNKSKLERVREGLAAIDANAGSLPILLGDSGDRSSLDKLARETRVLVSTVGPYALFGAELVAACVDAGTDYCDLTGEAQFIRRMIDAHHERAIETGSRIVHCCGFDSIPSDLGTLMVQTAMRERYGHPAREVRCLQSAGGASFSGGTVATTLLAAKEATTNASVRRVLVNPYSLDPGHHGHAHDDRDQLGIRWDPDLGQWTGPFFLAGTNARVVRRSNALLDHPYGRDFRYREALETGAGATGWLKAAGVTAGTAGFFAAAAVPPIRWLLARTVLPKPGEGPSKEARESGSFTTRFVAATDGGGPRLFGAVKGMQDPGYGETAKMLTESAVCLAVDGDAIAGRGGILTPAASMGMRLVERLRAAGMSFEVGESP